MDEVKPARAEVQDEDWRCPDCGAQADEWFDCCKNPARAEAQDEGAAGSYAVSHHAKTDADPVVSMLRDVAERLERPEPDLLGARVGVQAVRLAVSSRLLTHPSPTPAADADRVRKEIKSWTDTQFPKSCRVGSAKWVNGLTDRILAALKSTAAN